MRGIKVASVVIGGTIVAVVLVALLVIGLTSWLGWVGGPIALGVILLVMFGVIAVTENLNG